MALAFSLVIHADKGVSQLIKRQETARLNGLGALAVCRTLQAKHRLPAKIKWPNDILVNGKKLAGVLPELQWVGDRIERVILGIGINVATKSVPPAEWDARNPHSYPAICLESALGAPVNRWDLLYNVLEALLFWYQRINEPKFLETWQQNLAFLDEWVQIVLPGTNDVLQIGRIVGLDRDGALRLQDESGELSCLRSGIVHPTDPPFDGYHLRPVDSFEK
jgi:BirA family biotin operon repressor/biotin-[acetyl-CoA-carboxylase] ligase